MRLMPYLYAVAHEAPEHGWPMMRAMLLEFPQDRSCLPLDLQYMLGDRLLVAPVFSAAGDVEYYLPRGRWTSLLSGAVVEGPTWLAERHGFDSLPLFVREGSVLVTGAHEDTVDYDYQQDAVVTVYSLAEGATASATVHTPGGDAPITFTATRQDGRLSVTSTGAKPFTVVER